MGRPVLLVLLLHLPFVLAQAPSPQRAAQPVGTFTNPILPADFSDLDAIRAGSSFYAISSTFQYSPGMAILQSEDLVHWRILGHAIAGLTTLSPALNWDRMDRAGRGIWAGSLRFHANRFWIFFGTPDEGLFMTSAPAATGPWTGPAKLLAAPGWDDPCPFWDDDGTGYLVTTHFAPEPGGTTYNIHLFRLTSDSRRIISGSDRHLYRSQGSEANKLYKIHGLYYHLYSEVAPEGRVLMMRRAPSLSGPWQTHQLLHVQPAVDKEPNQGGLLELPDGRWFFLTHQGTGDWEGRAGALLPVTWIDGWPILGTPGPDGIGRMVWNAPLPLPNAVTPSGLTASGGFTQPTLQPQWEWNYQPRPGAWSLTERPGFLRLYAFAPLRPGDFFSIGDILTQRALRTARNTVTVHFDLTGLADGQEAALAHYALTFATLGVVQQGSIRTLSFNENGVRTPGPRIDRPSLWLRSTWDFGGNSRFSYSLDGQHFTVFGTPCQLTWGHYRGDRLGLLTVNPTGHGFLDIDSFHYDVHTQDAPLPSSPPKPR